MTPEERVDAIISAAPAREALRDNRSWLVQAIREAVAAEREACALLAEDFGAGCTAGITAAEWERRHGPQALAGVIRTRGTS